MLGSDTLSSMLLTFFFAWCYSFVFILSVQERSASNFSDIHGFVWFFWRINRLTETRCMVPSSGSHRHSPQWDSISSYIVPKRLHHSSSAGSGSSSPSTRQAPRHYHHPPALGDWWGSAAAGASTRWAGWGGAFRTMTVLCLEVCWLRISPPSSLTNPPL